MQYDIIIIGGGMVGASLACALKSSPLRIAMIDATPLQPKTDPRLIALNYSSYCLFQHLNLWSSLAPHAAAIEQIHVSDRGHFGKVRLNASDLQLNALGYVVPAQHINAVLNQGLSTLENFTHLRPATLKTLTLEKNGVNLRVETSQGETDLQATLVIGADGSFSTVREQLHITAEAVDYHQSAIVTTTELNRPHQHIAYERFHQNGAIAMLPLVGLACATIWSDTTETIQQLLALDDASFLARLQEHFGYRLGRLKKIGLRHHYPLKGLKCQPVLEDHVILIGNAAHTLHPIAAQGLNLALAEIAMLAQCIEEQADHLTQPNWQTYLAWQQQQVSASAGLSHQLPRLFSSDFSFITLARQIGMLGLDLSPSAKRYFSERSMGRLGALPKLLQDPNAS